MRTVTSQTTAAWLNPDKTGPRRPIVRATIQRVFSHDTTYDLNTVAGSFALHNQAGSGLLRSLYFDQKDTPREVPNIASVKWQRSIDADAATCTITLWNTEALPIGAIPDNDYAADLDQPGYLTYNRAQDGLAALYGQNPNSWKGWIVPDRVIRTYEGYGFDPAVIPELDPNLYLSGTWLIDDVTYNKDATITLECRDAGRLMIDDIVIPPLIPWHEYPLVWEPYKTVTLPDKVSTAHVTSWIRPRYQTDSSQPYIGKGYVDGGRPYVSSDGSVFGHHGRQAFDSSKNTYWWSVGNYPDWSSSYEWVQGGGFSGTLRAVKILPWAGPYTVYVSVYASGKWQGRQKIPYVARAVDAGTAIPFVHSFTVKRGSSYTEAILPTAIAGATKVRLTFHHLSDSGVGQYRWRAGAKDIQILLSGSAITTTPGGTAMEGNYGDYTDIVKWMCAWGGLHWPTDGTVRLSDGTSPSLASTTDVGVLPTGRAWGDFMNTGTQSIATLDATMWDKKSFADCISAIRDIVGFVFFMDETSGAIWRLPNMFSLGNYLWNASGGPNSGRTSSMITLTDDQVLIDSTPKLSSRNVRDRVFVGNFSGKFGATAAGFNPNPIGIPRIGGWTDQNFASTAECQVMADLITLRQAFEYRVDPIVIPGNPAIQCDDQVKVEQRVAGENYVHYVRGISMDWDAKAGRYVYTLDTSWLGLSPSTFWAFDTTQLRAETQAYLAALGF